MNLELTPEQQLIRDTARDFALRELEPHDRSAFNCHTL